MSQWWDNRTPVFAVVDVVPVDTIEEWMGLDTLGAAGHVSETVGAIDGAKLANYIFSVGRDFGLLGELNGFGNNSICVRIYD